MAKKAIPKSAPVVIVVQNNSKTVEPNEKMKKNTNKTGVQSGKSHKEPGGENGGGTAA